MNLLNRKMFQSISSLFKKNNELDPSLSNLISAGFIFTSDCFFLKNLYRGQVHISQDDFVDKTGYECFINSLHVDDYIANNFLAQSILFTSLLFDEWANLKNNLPLEIILSETDFGINIKFHVIREGEIWINENDLNSFEEALLICRNN